MKKTVIFLMPFSLSNIGFEAAEIMKKEISKELPKKSFADFVDSKKDELDILLGDLSSLEKEYWNDIFDFLIL